MNYFCNFILDCLDLYKVGQLSGGQVVIRQMKIGRHTQTLKTCHLCIVQLIQLKAFSVLFIYFCILIFSHSNLWTVSSSSICSSRSISTTAVSCPISCPISWSISWSSQSAARFAGSSCPTGSTRKLSRISNPEPGKFQKSIPIPNEKIDWFSCNFWYIVFLLRIE